MLLLFVRLLSSRPDKLSSESASKTPSKFVSALPERKSEPTHRAHVSQLIGLTLSENYWRVGRIRRNRVSDVSLEEAKIRCKN